MDPDKLSEPQASYGEVTPHKLGPGLEAFFMHQEQLQRRLTRVTALLDQANIPYALIGGNAVAYYVAKVDPDAVRTTADVDLLMNREDLPRAQEHLEFHGLKYRHAAGVHMFLDDPTASARSAVHVIPASEKVRPNYTTAAPSLEVIERAEQGFSVIPFARLVEMKLTSFRDKDRTHLRDFIDVGLLPGNVLAELAEPLRERLQYLLDHPE